MPDPPSTSQRTTPTPPVGASAARSPDSTTGPAKTARDPEGVPARVGRYEVCERLGAGAFGCVYRAFDPELNRDVAIKVPKADALTPDLLVRFKTEALAAAAIHHANVCPIYDVGTGDDGVPFLVMQFVAGGTLDGVLKARKKPYPARDAAAVVRKVALGVAAAHASGVLHRDLKPANVLWDEAAREVLVTDFGLARVAGAAQLSQTGLILGTPSYMSPEQARARPDEVGPLTDVYSLGVILYRLTTGTVPFEGSALEVLAQAQFDTPRPPSEVRPGLDPRVDALCAKAMAKRSADRYPSAKAFADALADFLRGSPDAAGDAREAGAGRTQATAVATRHALDSRPAQPPSPGKRRRRSGSRMRRWLLLPVGLVAFAVVVSALSRPGSTSPVAEPADGAGARPADVRPKGPELATVAPPPPKAINPIPVVPPPPPPPPPAPSLRLIALPDVSVMAWEEKYVEVRVQRVNLQGPITVRVEGLPTKVTAAPLTIPAGADSGQLVFKAAPSTTAGATNIRVVAASGSVTADVGLKVVVDRPPPDRPFRAAINGLDGKQFLTATTSPAAWRQADTFVRVKGKGELAFPPLQATRYVCDLEVELSQKSDVEFYWGPSTLPNLHLRMGWNDREAKFSGILWYTYQNGQTWCNGSTTFPAAQRLYLRLFVDENATARMYQDGRHFLVKPEVGRVPLSFRIVSHSASTDLTVHRCAFRPLVN